MELVYSGVLHSSEKFYKDLSSLDEKEKNRDLLVEFHEDDSPLVSWFSEADNVTTIEIEEDIGNPSLCFPDSALIDDGSSDEDDLSLLSDYGMIENQPKNIISRDTLNDAVKNDNKLGKSGKIRQFSSRLKKILGNESKEKMARSSFDQDNGQMLFDSSCSTTTNRKTGLRKRISVIKMKKMDEKDVIEGGKILRHQRIDVGPSLETLLPTLLRFMRISTAAYGASFLQLLGLGKVKSFSSNDRDHPPDHYTFSIHR
jgi:hypothetical protein